MRLADADAYSAEMKERQEAAWKWRNEAIAEEEEEKLARAEGAFTTFVEAKLTMDKHIINPWHRVEEEPKESGKQYVVWASKGYAYCDKWLGDRWLISSVAPETVTYWMPIEPPKEEE
jgi:hypothetical protein